MLAVLVLFIDRHFFRIKLIEHVISDMSNASFSITSVWHRICFEVFLIIVFNTLLKFFRQPAVHVQQWHDYSRNASVLRNSDPRATIENDHTALFPIYPIIYSEIQHLKALLTLCQRSVTLADTSNKHRFNTHHSRTRITIEHAFGRLKTK